MNTSKTIGLAAATLAMALTAGAALAQTRAINLRDDQPFGNQQPLEGFLGREVPELAHPKPAR